MAGAIKIALVNRYLKRIKHAITEGRYRFEGRRKNRDAMARAGLLPKHVKGIIMLLTYLNYSSGPMEEENPNFPPGEYLVFGEIIEGVEFYIKLKLEQLGDREEEICVCISFHEASGSLNYPLR